MPRRSVATCQYTALMTVCDGCVAMHDGLRCRGEAAGRPARCVFRDVGTTCSGLGDPRWSVDWGVRELRDRVGMVVESVSVENVPLTVVQREVVSGRQTKVGDQPLSCVGERVDEVGIEVEQPMSSPTVSFARVLRAPAGRRRIPALFALPTGRCSAEVSWRRRPVR